MDIRGNITGQEIAVDGGITLRWMKLSPPSNPSFDPSLGGRKTRGLKLLDQTVPVIPDHGQVELQIVDQLVTAGNLVIDADDEEPDVWVLISHLLQCRQGAITGFAPRRGEVDDGVGCGIGQLMMLTGLIHAAARDLSTGRERREQDESENGSLLENVPGGP